MTSNYVTMSIAPRGSVCSEPTSGLLESDLGKIQESGALNYGTIILLRMVIELWGSLGNMFTMTGDLPSVGFIRMDVKRLLNGRPLGNPPPGACWVSVVGPPGMPIEQWLDAGPVITLSGPVGTIRLKREEGLYVPPEVGPPALPAGVYTVNNGSGGKDVGPLSAAQNLPPPLVWTNLTAISVIDRGRDLTITWSGGDPKNEFVVVTGNSEIPEAEAEVEFTCTERVSAGRLTVPASILSSLPASQPLDGSLQLYAFQSTQSHRFQAQGLDFGLFTYASLRVKNLTYR